MAGAVPASYCDLPLLTDCRIGGDTNLTLYPADEYSWLQSVGGNSYDCASLSTCATVNRVCDKTSPCGPNGAWKQNGLGRADASSATCHNKY